MLHSILILDDSDEEGKRIQYNFSFHGVPACYRFSYLSGSKYSVIILIGHTEKYILKNIVEIRRNSESFIIVVYKFSGLHEKIKLLELGADDYLAAPFDINELRAKIKAVLRRMHMQLNTETFDGSCIHIKNLVVDTKHKKVCLEGREIKLTRTEYKILLYLSRNAGAILSIRQISNYVWKEHIPISTNSVICHIRNIRRKLGSDGSRQIYIETIKGRGYRITTK